MRRRLDRPPPDRGRPFADVLTDFRAHIEPLRLPHQPPAVPGVHPGRPCLPAVLGDWLTAAANFFAGVWLEGAGPTQVEIHRPRLVPRLARDAGDDPWQC